MNIRMAFALCLGTEGLGSQAVIGTRHRQLSSSKHGDRLLAALETPRFAWSIVPAQVWVSSPSQPARPRLRKAPVLGSQWRLAEMLGWEWERG